MKGVRKNPRRTLRSQSGKQRVVIEGMTPIVDCGRFPIKRVTGDEVTVEADCFADGHDLLACMLQYRHEKDSAWSELAMTDLGNDRWRATFAVDRMGTWHYGIIAWVDVLQSWSHDFARRVDADDLVLAAQAGAELIAAASTHAADDASRARLQSWAQALRETAASELKEIALDRELLALASHCAERSGAVRTSLDLRVMVDRPRARFSAWYEMFPRSAADEPGKHGTFADVINQIDYVAGMGFDVLYLPPIHPIGRARRKGRNNAVAADESDVGSPWAIGAAEGGHTAIHPALGTLHDFRRLIEAARAGGLEIAIDIAFQTAPDHPYVAAHPEWFRWRADGTVQYAENPPKKYQDIYPLNFESEDWRALWDELRRVFRFWTNEGVRIFRVDNPHTKPFRFWEWVIADIKRAHPDVLFLAEAFTRPRIMHRLAKLGFSQSYTYFTWRNTKQELTEYFTELSQSPSREYFRPNCWPNTPDILPESLRNAGRPAFALRLVLAATLAANYGIYGASFELMENAPRDNVSEEYLNSEKYELRHWERARADSLAPLIARINHIRREHPALQSDWTLVFHAVDNELLICYSKQVQDDTVLLVVNLDVNHAQSGWVALSLEALGISASAAFEVQDMLSGAHYQWQGARNFVRLDPAVAPAHIFHLSPPAEQARGAASELISVDIVTPSADIVTATDAAPPAGDPLWFKDAIIYQLHVKAFFDSNNDGVGDFHGLTEKLDYIQDLGVSAIWLLPFYPSPMRDDGYDVADYHNVYPPYGTRQDFRQFIREAHRRELKVITELVINHTSDQHPWFQAARRAPKGSSKRDFYVWSDDPKRYAGTRIIFTDTESSNWTWDSVAQSYFWHRFFSHQPDLNFDNPRVLQAVFRTMRFWLDQGVDGFRLDAIPYLIEREGTNNENLPETHDVIKQIRAALDRHYSGRVLLAEANQWPEDVRQYFGDGDECHMAYHFPLMPRIYMAIAQEDRYPVVEIMKQTPEIPDTCQWAVFLRNHDELTLEMVTSKERDYMYQMYAADPRARINLGIRRRLAPLMENDPDRIKLMNSLLLSMPGSPIIYYGDEIGMGDNFFLGDRNGVRTPMQWSPDRNAGFSRADPQRLYLPPIMDPIYGYESVNVEAQLRDSSSLLNWMKRMLAVRKSSRALSRGVLSFLKPGNRKVLAYLRELGDEAILCVANLARSAQAVELNLGRYKSRAPVELLGRSAFPPVGELPYMLTIPAYGFYWFRLASDADVPRWHQEHVPAEDVPVLVLFDGWTSLFRERVVPWRINMAEKTRKEFETDILPRHIETQRWYAAKGSAIARARIADHALWEEGKVSWLLQVLTVEGPAEHPLYFVPLALAWEDHDEERMRGLAVATVAKVRQQANIGLMGDAFSDEMFCRAVVQAIAAGRQMPTAHGKLRFTATAAFAELAGTDFALLPVSRPQAQSSNTLVALGERLFLKGYRRVRVGLNPELEIGRFLTEVAKFPNCVPVAGALEYTDATGATMTLALVQAYVSNQGDGWTYTLNYLERYLEERRVKAEPEPTDVHGAYLALIRTLGMRTAELHLAFAHRTGDPAFDPEPWSHEDLARHRAQASNEAAATLSLLESRMGELSGAARDQAQALLNARQRVLDFIGQFTVTGEPAVKTRFHGDFHLGQVLLTRNDFVIIDFEGEPGRSFAERRAKQLPLRDVAGMLRSFNYAQWSALRRAARDAAEFDKLAPLARAWEAQARDAFLRAYTAAVHGLAPADVEAQPARGPLPVPLFELEKAFYELRYELNNRPDWVLIPLQGILGMLATPADGSDQRGSTT